MGKTILVSLMQAKKYVLYTYADSEYKELKIYKPFYHFAGSVMTEGNI
jgi:hypothetical protein